MAGGSRQQKIPKHKLAKQLKYKTKASKTKPPKLRQTRLTFGAGVSRPADLVPVQPPRGGGRMEERLSSSSSLLGVVVTSPRTFNRETYSNYSLVPFQKPGQAQPSANEPLRTDSTTTILQHEELDPSPTSSPITLNAPRRGTKRKSQSRIDDLFLPDSSSPAKKRSPRVLDSDSDVDALDSFQLEAEKSTDPNQLKDDASDADSDNIVGPRVRRQRHLPSSPLADRADPHTPPPPIESEEELSEEVRVITSSARKSVVAQRMRDAKSRNKRKSQFQKNLESLRKKKQGVQFDSEDENEKGRALYDSASDVDSVASDDFIVNDEEELTMEQLMEIPPEFTSISYQGPQLNFKVVVQGEVYAVLHPDFHGLDYTDIRNPVDPYFKHAFKSLERQVSGITDSAISSNAWKPWFIRALKSRPEFESEEIPGDLSNCDACNISKRHATYIARLSGPKYNPNTLEVAAAKNDSYCYWDNENKLFLNYNDSEEEDLDEENITKVKLDREWALGQFCHNRAEVAHYFYHWRYHLREQVKLALRKVGWASQEKKNYVRNLPPDIQNKFSNLRFLVNSRVLEDVMMLLDGKRHIARMYKEYRERISTAREYLTGSGRGSQSSPQAKRFIRG